MARQIYGGKQGEVHASIQSLLFEICNQSISVGFHSAAPISMISYPGHGHDVLFDACKSGLTMSEGENQAADDIVAWIQRDQKLVR